MPMRIEELECSTLTWRSSVNLMGRAGAILTVCAAQVARCPRTVLNISNLKMQKSQMLSVLIKTPLKSI